MTALATAPRSPELLQFLRLTTAERQRALSTLVVAPKTELEDEPIFVPRAYRRRPRPGKDFRKLSEDERQALLNRETEECGPGILATRVRACIEARQNGDPRSLAGSLEDLAAAALSWSERTVADMIRPPKLL